MNFKIFTLLLILTSLVTGCNTTPGDAASRSGHPTQAADLYMQGAAQGDSSAALKLGLMLTEGRVSNTKYGNAIKWFIRACKLGSNAGCHNSGDAFEYGKLGAGKNYNKARTYYSLAAEKGYMQSQYNLGSLYSNQYFSNDIEGLKWMLIAEKTANNCSNVPLCQWVMQDPPGHRTRLMARMNESQIAASKRQASGWTVKK